MHNLGYNLVVCDTTSDIKKEMGRIEDSFNEDSRVDYVDIGSLNVISGTCNTKDEASKVLTQKYNENEYRSYAIKFNEKVSSSRVKAEEKLKKEQEKLVDYVKKNDISKHKSATVGCSRCGSKLATKYMKEKTDCPVCGNYLMSKTYQDTISRYKKNIMELQRELQKGYADKNGRTTRTKYLALISYDYHS